jgi:hypothetical protein
MSVAGAEPCCDGKTSWKFRVNGGKWLAFTTENLNNF